MPRPTRAQIYAALFARLETVPTVRTCSRRLQPFTKVPAAEQPALFLTQRHETLKPAAGGARNLPMLRQYECDVHVYVHETTCGTACVVDAVNAVLDAIEAALAPDRDGVCTLGGLVSHCRVSGTIETDEGTLGDQAIAIVPIELVPFP